MSRIGERLREIRKQFNNASQTQFALKFNISQSALSKYEKNLRDLSTEFLIQLRQLGISIDWLLTGEGEMFSFYQTDKSLKNEIEKLKEENTRLKKALNALLDN